MNKIYLSDNYLIVIDGAEQRLYPKVHVTLAEFSDHFLIENRVENQPKDTIVSFASLTANVWFDEAGTTNWTQATLRTLFTGISAVGASEAEVEAAAQLGRDGQMGYSHTGAFAGKPLDNQYVWQAGLGIEYSAADVAAETYKVFSLDSAVHAAVDNPYWTTPTPTGNTNIGLFQGANLPDGFTTLFDYAYDFDAQYPGSTGTGFEGSTGRIRLNDCVYGDQLRVRFDFNVIPQIANTTIEPALWYANRNDSDDITFTFPLTTSPVFYGTGTVGNTYLNRVEISAWITSNEDVNALTLPAIKSDNPIIIQPLGILATILR